MKKLAKSSILFILISILYSYSSDNKTSSNQNTSEVNSKSQNQCTTKFVNIATGGASSPYNVIETSLAELYNKTYGVNSKTQTTGYSVEILNLIKQNKVKMAFVMSDSLTEATKRTGVFSNSKVTNVQQIAALYPNYVQIVASKKSGIKNIED